jgi:transposase-like protein
MQQFKSLPEVIKTFADDKTCRAYLEQQLWNGRPVCPHCGCQQVYRLADGKNFKCGNKKTCDKKFTVTTGTMYENTKLPLSTWFAAIWLITAHKKGISSCQLARDLNITQKSAWFVLHRIRLVMGDPAPEPLEFLVEVDETYVGGTFANMHRGRRKKHQENGTDNKIAVMGMVERGGKAKLKVIGDNSFKDMVRTHVDTTAVVITDSHAAYEGLDKEYAGHETLNHKIEEYKRDIFYTNTVEGFFSTFKRGYIGIYHWMSPKHLHRYCEEFSHRYNSRVLKDYERFTLTIAQSKGRLKYRQLIAGPKYGRKSKDIVKFF